MISIVTRNRFVEGQKIRVDGILSTIKAVNPERGLTVGVAIPGLNNADGTPFEKINQVSWESILSASNVTQ